MRRRGVSRRLIGIMLVGVLLLAANAVGMLRPIAGLGEAIAEPFQAGLSGVGTTMGEWFHVIGSAGQLESENLRLRNQVSSLQQQLSQDTEIRAQNETLRKQLGIGSVQPDRIVAAEVLGYQPDNFRQFVTISRGSRDGIKSGMAVVEQGTLIGTISDVSASTSKVFLVIDPNFRVAAIDQDAPDRPSGTVHGQIGNGLFMDKIAQNETVKPGDTVVTSGLGGDVEKGLVIGHVQNVSKQDNGVFQTAQVTTDIQFNRLEIVYVVVRPQ